MPTRLPDIRNRHKKMALGNFIPGCFFGIIMLFCDMISKEYIFIGELQ